MSEHPKHIITYEDYAEVVRDLAEAKRVLRRLVERYQASGNAIYSTDSQPIIDAKAFLGKD